MKIKDGFIVRKIVDSWIAVPIGERLADTNGIISLSETGAFLWNILQNNCTESSLVEALKSEYEVDEATANTDVFDFISSLKDKGLLQL